MERIKRTKPGFGVSRVNRPAPKPRPVFHSGQPRGVKAGGRVKRGRKLY